MSGIVNNCDWNYDVSGFLNSYYKAMLESSKKNNEDTRPLRQRAVNLLYEYNKVYDDILKPVASDCNSDFSRLKLLVSMEEKTHCNIPVEFYNNELEALLNQIAATASIRRNHTIESIRVLMASMEAISTEDVRMRAQGSNISKYGLSLLRILIIIVFFELAVIGFLVLTHFK